MRGRENFIIRMRGSRCPAAFRTRILPRAAGHDSGPLGGHGKKCRTEADCKSCSKNMTSSLAVISRPILLNIGDNGDLSSVRVSPSRSHSYVVRENHWVIKEVSDEFDNRTHSHPRSLFPSFAAVLTFVDRCAASVASSFGPSHRLAGGSSVRSLMVANDPVR